MAVSAVYFGEIRCSQGNNNSEVRPELTKKHIILQKDKESGTNTLLS